MSVPGIRPRTGAATATTSAAALVTGDNTGGPSKRRAQGLGVLIKAMSTNSVSVFVGGSDVTTSTGIELAAGASVTIEVDDPSKIYIICASSTPEVRFMYA